MPTLATKAYCTGCTACASACPKGCISMVADENGFFCSVADAECCIECGLCEKACPAINPAQPSENKPIAYAAYSKDEAMRLESSSGGVFTELAKAILKEGGTVFGAAYNENFEVVHICVEKEALLGQLRGAKYAQSDLGCTFLQVKQRLERGQQVLFSGTPCQVVGLKSFLMNEYKNLLTVDFVCHSISSPMAWKSYVSYRAQQDSHGQLPMHITLRSKHTGWSRYQYSNLFEYASGVTHSSVSSESLYMRLFCGGYINRECCENCLFKGYSRVSDLTLGDFWGIWDIAPKMDDNKGTSLIFVQSNRGAELLKRISGQLIIELVSLEEASKYNNAILQSSQAHPRRSEALAAVIKGDYDKLQGWFIPTQLTLTQKLCRKLYQFGKRLGI